jgi:hypothetical protein
MGYPHPDFEWLSRLDRLARKIKCGSRGRLKWEYEGLLTDGNACAQIPWEGPWEGPLKAPWLMVERIRFDEQ